MLMREYPLTLTYFCMLILSTIWDTGLSFDFYKGSALEIFKQAFQLFYPMF